MKILIVTASRYGSTAQGAEWIAERLILAGEEVQTYRVEDDAPSPADADLVILGSGLYAHKLLPGLDNYIDKHIETLCKCKIALFALAMRTGPVFTHAQAHGGLAMLQPYFEKLRKSLIHAEILGGQMVFDRLTAQDAAGLEKFYAMLKLTPDEIEKRKAPRTLMSKADYWAFAEDILRKMKD